MRYRIFAVDAGQSSTRGQLLESDGKLISQAESHGIRHLASAGALDLAVSAVSAVWRVAVPPGTTVRSVGVGFTGWGIDSDRGKELVSNIAHQISTSRIRAASDALTSFVGAAEGIPGVVLTVGTGSVAVAADGTGQWRRVDGRGPFLGDEGSGFWVGRRGLIAALQAADRGDHMSELLRRAVARYGSVDAVEERVNASVSPVALVASFAADVSVVATMGDPVARSILAGAGKLLALSADSAAGSMFSKHASHQIVVTGGLVRAGRPLTSPLRRALLRMRPGANIVFSSVPPIRGAAILAESNVGAHWFPDQIVEWSES